MIVDAWVGNYPPFGPDRGMWPAANTLSIGCGLPNECPKGPTGSTNLTFAPVAKGNQVALWNASYGDNVVPDFAFDHPSMYGNAPFGTPNDTPNVLLNITSFVNGTIGDVFTVTGRPDSLKGFGYGNLPSVVTGGDNSSLYNMSYVLKSNYCGNQVMLYGFSLGSWPVGGQPAQRQLQWLNITVDGQLVWSRSGLTVQGYPNYPAADGATSNVYNFTAAPFVGSEIVITGLGVPDATPSDSVGLTNLIFAQCYTGLCVVM